MLSQCKRITFDFVILSKAKNLYAARQRPFTSFRVKVIVLLVFGKSPDCSLQAAPSGGLAG